MAIALVSGQHAQANFGGSASSISVSFPAGTTAGNLICELSLANSAQNPTTPTDDKSNTYAVSAPQTVSVAGGQVVTGYYSRNCIGGTVVVTANFSAPTSFQGIAISEYSGADPSTAVLDQSGGLYTASTADAFSPPKNPSVPGELIWGGCVNNIGASNTSGTIFTLLDTNAASGHAHEYAVQTAALTVSTEFKAASGGAWAVLIATFRPVIDPHAAEALVFAPAVLDGWGE